MERATNVGALHSHLERESARGGARGDKEASRFRVEDCEEAGKRFMSIAVRPHFI